MYFNNNSVKVSRQFFFLRVSTLLIGCCFFKLLIKRARESRELRDFSGSGSGSTKKQWLHGSTALAPARLHKPVRNQLLKINFLLEKLFVHKSSCIGQDKTKTTKRGSLKFFYDFERRFLIILVVHHITLSKFISILF